LSHKHGYDRLGTTLLLVAAVAFLYYAPSLRFGFFNDDPTGHFRWMAGRSLWSLLTDAGGHGYYRPFSFILWQMLHALLGRHDPFVLHLLNVLTHAANAALVAWLAHRLTRRSLIAALAGLLFALCPFSYEAVPYVGSFVHPLVTLLMLLTLAFALRWQVSRSWLDFAAAHAALTLALFTQENAVLTPVLIAGLWLLNQKTRRGESIWSFFIEPALFAGLWLLVPKAADARTISLAAASANVLPFVQALVYPVAPLANHSPAALAILALVSLTALFLLAHYARALPLFSFGLLLWALASLPSLLLLDNAYVLGSPRLFYLASAGVALVWAALALALERLLKFDTWYLNFGIWLLVPALCILPTARYTRCQLAYQGLASEAGQMMARATHSVPPSSSVTFINLPYFFSSRGPGTECRSPFVYAPTGAVVLPPYADARDFAFYNGGADLPTTALTVREYQPGWQTFGRAASVEELRAQLGTARVFVFDLLRWRVFDLSAVWQTGAATQSTRSVFDGAHLSMTHYRLSKEWIEVTLVWQAVQPVAERKVFVHVYNASGQVAAQHDSVPAQGFAPASWWRAGDTITDTHIISVAHLPPGTYRVAAGMYNAVSGQRTPAQDASGARLPDDVLIISEISR